MTQQKEMKKKKKKNQQKKKNTPKIIHTGGSVAEGVHIEGRGEEGVTSSREKKEE